MFRAKPARAPRILLIDDEPQSVALLLSYLQDQNMDILVALDGEDGLRKAQIGEPDLILLDVLMPHLDGYEVCRRLKSNPATATTPILFLSARKTLPSRLEGFAAGGIDYIAKPFSAEEVLARINAQLQVKDHLSRLEAIATRNVVKDSSKSGSRDDTLFARTITHLENTLAAPCSMRELAHQMKTTEHRLAALFRQRLGMTVSEYFYELRLETARRLLHGSNLRIQMIADRVGYRNAGDFTRAFRRRYGVAPRSYRNAHPPTAPTGEAAAE